MSKLSQFGMCVYQSEYIPTALAKYVLFYDVLVTLIGEYKPVIHLINHPFHKHLQID